MPSAILVAFDGRSQDAWYEGFRAHRGDRDIRFWPNQIGNPADIVYACVMKAPHGLFASMPNLKAIFNIGAGADHLLGDPQLPDVPIARGVYDDLTMRMTEYVVLHVLMHHRRQPLYTAQQREKVWRGHHQPAAHEVTVGVMGIGAIGADSAAVLKRLGFQVAGWSRSPKEVPGIEVFHGADGLEKFLARTEILAVLLPHTPETEGILNLSLFRKLKHDGALGGAYLVNAGRGKLQVEADIVAAFDQGALAGASLDVFATEPLPTASPLWTHPKAVVTPHNAGDLEPRQLVPSLLAQIDRFEAGEPPRNLVDRRRGY
jgi:glyoxylate/hydroxypyruvate reductase A